MSGFNPRTTPPPFPELDKEQKDTSIQQKDKEIY